MSGPSRRPRTGSTVRLDWLMDQTQRLEIASRIAQLRERSPFTQPQVADQLGLTLRGYQKIEAKGTASFERCEELAKIHSVWTGQSEDYPHVTASWIYNGEPTATPDLAEVLGDPVPEADDVRELLTDALDRLEAIQSTLDAQNAEIADMRQQIDGLESTPARRASGDS